jgi:hypothetical protein
MYFKHWLQIPHFSFFMGHAAFCVNLGFKKMALISRIPVFTPFLKFPI